jgi:Tfp pilus assembly protein PilF
VKAPRGSDLAVCAALVALVAAVFGQTLSHDFVGYDDPTYVTDNPQVLRGITPQGVTWALIRSGEAGGIWAPLTFLSHMLDCQLFGIGAAGHHCTNVLLHAANSVLLYWVLVTMTAARWPSALTAALFAVHPLHVESVAWVSERKDLLCGFFFMLCLGAYAAYARRRGIWRYLVVIVTLVLGLMSKPMLVTVPALLLVLDCWPLKRPARWKWLVLEKVPMLLVAMGTAAVAMITQRRGGFMRTLDQFPLAFRISNAIVSYARYLQKTVWPTDLAVFYPAPEHWPIGIVLGAAALLIALTTAAILLRRRAPYLLAGWLWFGGMLLPVIGIIQVGRQAMADRYSYLPHIGIFIALAWAAAVVRHRSAMTVIASIIVLALALRAVDQVSYWKNTDALFEHALAVTPENAVALNQVGNTRARQNRLADAEDLYRRALQLDPDYGMAHLNLGNLLARRREFAAAAEQYEAALRWRSNLPRAQLGLAVALAGLKEYDRSDRAFAEALRLSPVLAEAQLAWGSSLKARGRNEEAAEHFRAALEINPQLKQAQRELWELSSVGVGATKWLPGSRPTTSSSAPAPP